MNNKIELITIAIVIAKIENRDPNYRTNKKWLKLRSTQDYLFSDLANRI